MSRHFLTRNIRVHHTRSGTGTCVQCEIEYTGQAPVKVSTKTISRCYGAGSSERCERAKGVRISTRTGGARFIDALIQTAFGNASFYNASAPRACVALIAVDRNGRAYSSLLSLRALIITMIIAMHGAQKLCPSLYIAH